MKESHPIDSKKIEAMVEVERPSHEDLRQYNRWERYKALRANTTRRRQELINWLEEKGYTDEVARVSEPTAFNLISIDATPEVVLAIKHAPGVLSVSTVDEIEVDFPEPDEIIDPDEIVAR